MAQSITIKASSGLSEEEVTRMISDAEVHAAEDQKFRELAELRNQSDARLHSARKSLGELGEKVSARDKAAVEASIKSLEKAIGGNDRSGMQGSANALDQQMSELMQRYSREAEPRGKAGTGARGDSAQPSDDVVDAEFENVSRDRHEPTH